MFLSVIGNFIILVFCQLPKEKKQLSYISFVIALTVEDRLAIVFSVFTTMLFKNTLTQRHFLTLITRTVYSQ